MQGELDLARYFELQRVYQKMLLAYSERGVVRTLDPNDKEFPSGVDWALPHYFDVGADGLRVIVKALVGNLREPPQSILDFPSGSGRMTRHLSAFFHGARIVACDLYDYHVNFCVRELGVEGIMSKENIDEIDFGQTFDLIFCGSLLTHLPADQFRSVLHLLTRSLTERGVAIVTLHGRQSEFIQQNKQKYVDDKLFDLAKAKLEQSGFAFVDYDPDFRDAKFSKQLRYGVTFSRPRWAMKELEHLYDVRVLGYTERDWDDHHDVLVFGRPEISLWPGRR